MSLLKEIGAHATSAWSPIATKSNILAIGSKEGVGVGFDNYGGELALHSMDFSNVDPITTSIGSVKTTSRFLSLAWAESMKHVTLCPYGLIAGGMSDGTVNIWDPSKLMKGANDEAQVGSIQQHKGGVNTIQFNPHKDSSHLLASGGSDNEVFIMSLENLAQPGVFSPGGPTAAKHTSEVSCLAWNTQVSYIVATGSLNGSTIIWDLKQKKPWCELKDPHRGSVSAVAWNPDEGLHIITASGDDQRPVLRLWDLRSSTSTPLAELHGHTAGILSMSWCPSDTGLVLSCGKDNKTLLWDLFAGKSVFEFPSTTTPAAPSGSGQFFAGAAGGQRRFDVSWSKRIPAVAAASTFDGKVQVWGLAGTGTEAARAPKWCRRPATASFGFGGKLITVSNPKKDQPGPKLVHLHHVCTEPSVVQEAERVEAALQQKDFKSYCQQKVALATSPDDKDIWSFMQILFEQDARQQLLLHLGFDAENIAAQVAKYTGKKPTTEAEHEPPSAEIAAAMSGGVSADDIFSSGAIDPPKDEVDNAADMVSDLAVDNSKRIEGGPIPVYTEDGENMIQKALLVGNFEAAVDCCLRNNQLADALLLATCGGSDLWQRTQDAYFKLQKRPFLKIISAIIKSQLATLVDDTDLATWQETLAILSTYGKSEEFPSLCELLAQRLEAAGDIKSAGLCYMCAVNVEKTVHIWVQKATIESKIIGQTAALQNLVEKVSIFAQALDPPDQDMGPEVAHQYSAYAALIASQGRLDIASRYCTFQDASCAIMRDRLYHAAPPPGVAPPPFPFDDTSASQQQVQQQHQQPVTNQGYNQTQSQQQGYHQPQQHQPFPGQQQQYPGQQQQPSYPGQQQQPSYPGQQQPYPGQQQQPFPGQTQQQQYPGQQPQYGQQPFAGQQSTAYPSPQGAYASQPQGFQQSSTPQGFGAPAPSIPGGYNQGGFTGMAMNQQSTGVNSLAEASKHSNRVSTTPLDMNKQRTDGFVSSVGNKELTMKYGNVGTHEMSPVVAKEATPAKPLGCVDDVPPKDMPIVKGFNDTIAMLENSQLSGAERRQLAEMKKAKDIMFTKLNSQDLSDQVVAKLHEMIACFASRDFRSAQQLHVTLTTTDWAEHKDWLRGVKALITTSIKRLS